METATPIVLTVIAGLIATAIGLKAKAIGIRLDILDTPDGGRKDHEHVTPLTGGLCALLPVLLLLPAVVWLNPPHLNVYLVLGPALIGFLLLGLFDDRQHIRPSIRLMLSMGMSAFAMLALPALNVDFLNFSFLDKAVFLDEWGVVFSILSLVGLQNAINMADGRNGLVSGLSLIWLFLIGLYAPPFLLPVIVTALAGVAVAFVFNIAGRLFLGDGGAYGLAFLIGTLAILTYFSRFDVLPADVVALWFLIPVTDCLRLMSGRILRGRSPFEPDRNHLHHHLNRLMRWRYGLALYLALVLLPGLLAYWAPHYTPVWAAASLIAYGAILSLVRRAGARRPVMR